MAMKLLTFHDQLVAFFSPDDQDDNLVTFDIIQGTQAPGPKFELGQRIGPQALDRFRGRRWLVLQPGQNGRFEESLVACRQAPQLPFRVVRDDNLERHGSASMSLMGQARDQSDLTFSFLASPNS
jgi:hypothetical protein